jgi:hypothetical protein
MSRSTQKSKRSLDFSASADTIEQRYVEHRQKLEYQRRRDVLFVSID